MRRSKSKEPVLLPEALVQAWATNERINRYLLENLDERAWRADPPDGKGRTIAAIFAHIHNVRGMWLTVSAKGTKVPEKVDRDTVTRAQAKAALRRSAKAMSDLLKNALATGGRVKDFRPDVVGFFAYAVSHEAHHRGQITMLARQVGYPLEKEVGFQLWDWDKR